MLMNIMSKKYLAEFVGTFALSFVVLVAVAHTGELPLAVPAMAALTLGLFVYTIGSISGSHINPAVTIGLWSVKKINTREATGYIAVQIFAAATAILVSRIFGVVSPAAASSAFDVQVFLAEMLGTFFFTFGIATLVYGNVKDQVSGLVVGGSLLLGILIASLSGSSGILNPAVAFALNSISLVYIFGPIVGALIGFRFYSYLSDKK